MNTLYDIKSIIHEQRKREMIPLGKGTKFLVVGEIASGKTRISNEVARCMCLKTVCSYTTREKRFNEFDGKEHYYVTDAEFDKILQEKDYVAYSEFAGSRYCTTLEELDNSDIYVITPDGVEELKRKYSDRYTFIVIYVHTPYIMRRLRASTRSDFKDRFDKRVSAEINEFFDFTYHRKWDYLIDNSVDLAEALVSFMLLVSQE